MTPSSAVEPRLAASLSALSLAVDRRLGDEHVSRTYARVRDACGTPADAVAPRPGAKSVSARTASLDVFIRIGTARMLDGEPGALTRGLVPDGGSRGLVRARLKNHEPGDRTADFNRFGTDAAVPARYRADARFSALCRDGGQGGAITPSSRKEAMTALELEQAHRIVGANRDPHEASVDFRDSSGAPYDVKTPYHDIAGAAAAVLKKGARRDGQGRPIRIVLDTTYISTEELGVFSDSLAQRLAESLARQQWERTDLELTRVVGTPAAANAVVRDQDHYEVATVRDMLVVNVALD